MSVAENKLAEIAIQKILRRYYAVWLIYSFAGGFLFGVYPIFLKARGLSQFQINSVLATFMLVLFLTDVPTGVFADALGRRRSFVLGACLRVIAFVSYFFAHHYFVFLIAECIDGIGTTFGNGSIDAWGVDALDQEGYLGLKDGLFSRISQLNSVAFMGSAILGAYIADVNIAWPWAFSATGWAISAVIGYILMTGESERHSRIDWAALPGQIAQRIVEGVRAGFRSKPVLLLSAAGAIQVAAFAPYWLGWPIMFHDSYHTGVWIIGWIYSLLTLARIFGAEVVSRSGGDESSRAGRVSLLVFAAGLLLALAGLLQPRPNYALAALFVMNICTGASTPLLQSWLNEQIESDQRATMLSFNSTFATIGGSMGLIMSGFITDAAGMPTAWQVAGALSILSIPCYLALRPQAVSAIAAPAK